MDAIASIRDRYGFELPALYRTLLAKGHFSTTPWENYLDLHDCEWLSLEQIATYEFLDFQITSDGGFVPLAISARRDEWCWRLDWASGGEAPIVFCERSDKGHGYAPHFQGFLYRRLFESFAGYDGPEDERGLQQLRHAVAIVAPYLPATWAGQLRQLAERDFGQWQRGPMGEIYLVPQDQLAAVVAEQLPFAHLNEVFVQDKDLLKRARK